jgi:hypothetical protein
VIPKRRCSRGSQDISASGFLFQAKTDEKAGHRREATWMTAIETFKLNLLAYPDSADALSTLPMPI